MHKHSWRRCIKWEKDLPNNKCHEIPCETRAVHEMASHYCNGDSLKLVIMYIFLIGKSFVKITLQNSISKRIWNIHCWAIRAPTSSHGRDRAPDSFTLSQSNVAPSTDHLRGSMASLFWTMRREHGSRTMLWTYEWRVMAHARRRSAQLSPNMFFLFRYSFRLIPYNIQAFFK